MVRRTFAAPASSRTPAGLVALALALAAAVAAGASCGGAPKSSGPHLIFVTIDALRSDHLSIHGYPRETSPEIDAFARAAWDFPGAITLIPKTGPAMTTHLSGVPPCEHRATSNRVRVPGDVPMLAEILRAGGYRTAAFVGNPVLSRSKGFDRGFEVYLEIEEPDVPADVVTFERDAGVLNAPFLNWARGRSWSEPTFVWIHYLDPHGPYTPPARHEALFLDDAIAARDERRVPIRYDPLPGMPVNYVLGAIPRYQVRAGEDRVARYVSRYDAEIRFVDEAFGEVIRFLRERGLFDRSAVLLSADHGESLGERDYWFEHGWFACEGTLRIPMILKPPGAEEGRTIEGAVSILDTTPTLLALAGLPRPEGLAGRNLLEPLPRDEALLVENASTYPDRWFGVRTSRHKFLREAGGREELYDLAADPNGERNVLADRPDVAATLRATLERALEACRGRARGDAVPVLPGEEAKRLEQLGYGGD